MNPFFATFDRQEKLEFVAASWLDTPFVAHANIKGSGVDCVHLAGSIYIECGFLALFDPPEYSCDGAKTSKVNKIINWVESSNSFFKLEIDKPANGDLVCFRIGPMEYHVGVKISGDSFIHCIRGQGTVLGNIRDSTWAKRLTAIYRPIDPVPQPKRYRPGNSHPYDPSP